MSSRSKRRTWSNRPTPRVPTVKRTVLQFERLEDRTMLDATGLVADSAMLAAAKQITRDFFSPLTPQTKNGVTVTPQAPGVYTGMWVVGLQAGVSISDETASLSATSGGATGLIQNTYFVDFGSQSPQQAYGKLQWEATAGRVQFYYPLLGLQIVPNFVPNDPLYNLQWHLNNTGQSGGTPGQDIRAQLAWDQATGNGVVIGVVDDGVQLFNSGSFTPHPDLIPNLWVNPGEIAGNGIDDDGNGRIDDVNGWDFLNNDKDPSPASASDPHGTAVAGMAAAKGNNAVGVAGVAFDAKIAPIRIFSATTNPNLSTTDATIASALTYKNQNIQIYNNSWGPAGGSPYFFPAGPLTLAAFQTATTSGRGGLGSIIVRSAGNGGASSNVNRSTLLANRNEITVASVNNLGTTNAISTPGAAILVSAPANPNVSSTTAAGTTLSTDLTGANGYNGYAPDNNYTSNFGDTSAAAAVVSGVVALMLQKNPNLRFSDVQEILARTARKNNPADAGWALNSAGLNIHNNYGFGVVDANAAVTMAGTFAPKPQSSITSGTLSPNLPIPDANATGITVTTSMPNSLNVQAVEVEVNVPNHTWRGDLNFQLTSPTGTISLLEPNNISDSNDGLTTTFTTFRDMGESSGGTWSLKVWDSFGGDTGTLVTWKLNIFGTPPQVVGTPDSYTVPEDTTLNVPAPGVLGNDIAATAAVLISGPVNSSVFTFNSNGSFSYRGKQDFFGSDSFTYRPTQGPLQGGITTVSITITPVNDAPVANPDGTITPFVARPNRALVVPANLGVLPNDTDIDSANLTALLATAPSKGNITLASNGGFTYTARNNTSGPDSFTYRASDGQLQSNPATVSLQVNTPPVANNDSFNMVADTSLSGSVLLNDSDLDGNAITPVLLTAPSKGTLTLNPDGTFAYIPFAGEFGIDTFTYRGDDPWFDAANPDQIGNTGTVTIRIDRLPVAGPDAFSVVRDGVLEVLSPGLMSNDSDLDTIPFGDIVQTQLVSSTTNGSLTMGSNGYFKYIPNPGFFGTDSFVYRDHDGLFPGLPTTVTITVLATPSAVPDSYVTFGETLVVPAATGVLANDDSPTNAPLSARINTVPANGSVTLSPDGSFTYVAINGFVGVDSFTYIANDGTFDSSPATVTISVFGLNRPPVANNDTYIVSPGVPFTAPAPGVLANDTDPDGNSLMATLVTGPLNGTLSMNLDGGFTYTPLSGFVGTDSFTYQASDGQALSNVATVTLNVGSIGPGPTNPNRRIILSQDIGGQVKVFAGETGQSIMNINAYPGFTGSVRVAVGDVTGDGVPDIVTAPGSQSGTAAALKVLGFDGLSGQSLGIALSPFGLNYKGGIQIAMGDVDGDGKADIIMSADSVAATQQVRVVSGKTGGYFTNYIGTGFKPYTGTAFGGVRVAAGDVNGDGRAEIIVAPGAGAGPLVKIYNPLASSATTGLLRTFTAYTAATTGGVFVAAGDLDGDGKAEIVTGAATNAQGHVRIFNGSTGAFLRSLNVAGTTSGPARVAVGDINGDGKLDLVVGMAVSGSASRGRVYDATTLQEMFAGENRFTFGGGYTGRLFAASLNTVS